MPAESLRYAVIIEGGELPPAAVLAKALAPARRAPVQDLLIPMRRCWGLIELDAEESAAKEEARLLAQAGVRSLAIPANLVEEAPPAELVHEFERRPLPARLLAAAVFRQTTQKVVAQESGPTAAQRALTIGLSMATGLPLGVGGGKKVERRIVESGDLVYWLDVYAGQPLRRYRLAAHDFDFSCLGERMGFDAAGNFRRILEWLAPDARALNRGARGILEGKPMRDLGYESLADLDREGRWRLTLQALKA
jgi:hypothetical protein